MSIAGKIFMNNIHGQRVNMDILTPVGSGFVGSHGPDFLLTGDLASQMLNFRYGPDGQAYVIDWYDMNACHHTNVEGHDRTNGRIYKIVYGDAKGVQVDLSQKSDLELAGMVLEKNDWYVRHARRLLAERAAAGPVDQKARERLTAIATTNEDATRRLRAMWALHVTGGLPADLRPKLLADGDQYVRAWTIQLLLDSDEPPLEWLLPHLAAMARDDSSPVVRLYIASALGRLPAADRWAALEGLVRHAEDVSDHNLPLMYWYAAEPLAPADPKLALRLALACRESMPVVAEFLVRRLASLDDAKTNERLVSVMGDSVDAAEQLFLLKGLRQAVAGRRRVKPPWNWHVAASKALASDNEEVRNQIVALGVTYGDEAAMDALRTRVDSTDAPPDARREALQSLLTAKDPQLAGTLLKLLDDPALRAAALSGLATYDEAQSPPLYSSATPNSRPMRSALPSPPSVREPTTAWLSCTQLPTTKSPPPICRPTWSGSFTSSRAKTSTSSSPRFGGRFARRPPTRPNSSPTTANSWPRTLWRRTQSWAELCLPKPATSVTRSTAPAAPSAPTSPAPTGPTSNTCSRTLSTPAP